MSRFAGSDRLLPESWRVRMPRYQLRREFGPPRWIAATLVILFLLAAGAGAGYLRSVSIARDRLDALAIIDDRLARADANDDASELGLVRGQLRTLATRYGASADLDHRQARLYAIEDRLLGRSRLDTPVELGRLPDESLPADRPVHLLHAGSSVFVAGTALFELDRASGQLVRVLGDGDVIDGQATGPIVGTVTTRSGIAVTDGATLFARNSAGRWSAESFDAQLDLSTGSTVAIAVYEDQMIAIDRSTGAIVSVPFLDTATGGSPALPSSILPGSTGALDLAVDDQLFVLRQDGELVAFDRGWDDSSLTIPVSPELNAPRAMDAGSTDVWILDAGSGAGRLIRYAPDENRALAYELPVAGPDRPGPLSGASDFAIDEAGGRIVFVVDHTLWSSRLPAAS